MPKRKAQSVDSQDKPEVRKRVTTLFDAVAGRAGYESFLPHTDRDSKFRDTTSTSKQAVHPEEVLFRRKGAPIRYEENDVYFANERLPPDQKLPDSELLKELHCYVSQYYSKATNTAGKRDWKSLDETAMLAIGILLEEAVAESLGTTGHLAFLEDEREDHMGGSKTYWDGEQWARSVVQKATRSKDV